MIEANKRQAKVLKDALTQWQQQKLLSEEQANQLNNSIIIQTFDWKKLAKYSFVLAILCVIGSVISILADNFLLELLFNILGTEWGAVIVSSLFATGFILWGGKKKRHPLEKKFTSEALLAIGGIFIGVAIIFFGEAISTGSGHFSLLLLLGAIIYAPLAIYYQSISLWSLLLFSSTAWFGSELGYLVDYEETILGLSYFVWYLVWGGFLIGVSKGLEQHPRVINFAPITYTLGLLVVFFNMWFLSIDIYSWLADGWVAWVWTVLLAMASFAALVWGIKQEDFTLKALGLCFLLLNIYTKYIQYLWEELHSAIFFAILAASFWLIGTRAEDIWSGRFWKGSDDLLDDV
ncbi:MAG: hypothetical protein ACRBFS_19215 [Aureispira sp.]